MLSALAGGRHRPPSRFPARGEATFAFPPFGRGVEAWRAATEDCDPSPKGREGEGSLALVGGKAGDGAYDGSGAAGASGARTVQVSPAARRSSSEAGPVRSLPWSRWICSTTPVS